MGKTSRGYINVRFRILDERLALFGKEYENSSCFALYPLGR